MLATDCDPYYSSLGSRYRLYEQSDCIYASTLVDTDLTTILASTGILCQKFVGFYYTYT